MREARTDAAPGHTLVMGRPPHHPMRRNHPLENMKSTGCGLMDGALPGKCASMVFPYIPVQGMDPARYDQREALAIGTLFPGLNLPFFRAVKSRMNCDNNALCELMALGFGPLRGLCQPAEGGQEAL